MLLCEAVPQHTLLLDRQQQLLTWAQKVQPAIRGLLLGPLRLGARVKERQLLQFSAAPAGNQRNAQF